MSSKKRNLLTLVLLIAVGAVLARLTVSNLKPQDPRLLGDPNQIVVETRYSSDWHKTLGVRRGPTQLFELPRGFGWDTGGTSDDVRKALGPPQYTTTFLDQEYFIWEERVRYDWDFDNEYAGNYLTVTFRYNGRVHTAGVAKVLPPESRPVKQGYDPLPKHREY